MLYKKSGVSKFADCESSDEKKGFLCWHQFIKQSKALSELNKVKDEIKDKGNFKLKEGKHEASKNDVWKQQGEELD